MKYKNLSISLLVLTLVACGGSGGFNTDGTIGTPGVFAFQTPQPISVPTIDPAFAALSTNGIPQFGLNAVSLDGKMVGGFGEATANGSQYDMYVYGYLDQAPVHVVMPHHHYTIYSINRHGQMVGTVITGGHYEPSYWESPILPPVSLAKLHADCEAMSINDSGEIVGVDYQGATKHIVHWSSHTATPTMLTEPTGFYSDSPTITVDGTIFGRISADPGLSSPTFRAVWTNANATGVQLPDLGTTSPDIDLNVNVQTDVAITRFLATGGGNASSAIWTSPSRTIQLVNGTGNNGATATADIIGRDGSLYGFSSNDSALVWQNTTSTPVTLQSLLPAGTTGYDQSTVRHVLSDGTVIGTNGATLLFYTRRK